MRHLIPLVLATLGLVVIVLAVLFFGIKPAEKPAVVIPAAKPAVKNRPLADIITSKGTIRVALFADEAPKTVANFLGLADGTKESVDLTTNAKVKKPFYDGLIFHRVIKGFMIQGGDPLGSGIGSPGYSFADEINGASLGLDKDLVLLPGDVPNPDCAYQMDRFSQAFVLPALQARNMTPQTPQEEMKAVFDALLPELRKVTLRQFYEKIGYVYDDTLPASPRPVKGCLAMANAGPATNGSQFFINLVDTPRLTGKHTVFGEVISGMEVVEAIGEVAVDTNSKPLETVTIISIRSVKADNPTGP